MKILWFTWKDKKNPLAGGAEAVNEELAKRLVHNGHRVIFLVASFEKCKKKEVVDGYKIIRVGNRWSVYWQAYQYYKKNLIGWADLIIDEVNTIPFFTKFYIKEKNIIFVHQLCKEIWFYQMPFPLNFIGYVIEPIYLWLLRDSKVITVSESTKNDLLRHGFKKNKVFIISEGIEIEPVKNVSGLQKYKKPTLLSVGAVRPMKRTNHAIKAFEIAKKKIPKLQLIIAGDTSSKYGKKVFGLVKRSKYSDSIQYLGKINTKEKAKLMQESHLIVVTSIKEGWGLIVTEANSQGTPAIVYNVDGLRDSVKNNETGIICQQNNPRNLAKNIIELLNNREKYQNLRLNAWQWSKKINFEKSYQDFEKII